MGERIAFFDACAKGVMCPIGQGLYRLQGGSPGASDIDYHGYITIEQERDPRNSGTSLRDVTRASTICRAPGSSPTY